MINWWTIAFYMVAFALLPLSGFIIGNIVTRGLLWKIARTFAMRRKGAVLIRVHTVTEPYYRVGKLQDNFLRYKPRNNKLPNGVRYEKLLVVPKGAIQRDFWVPYMETDESTNNILRVSDWTVVSSSDPVQTDGLMKRLAVLRKLNDKKELIILILCGVTLLVAVYIAYNQGHVMKSLEALTQLIATQNNIPPGAGNI